MPYQSQDPSIFDASIRVSKEFDFFYVDFTQEEKAEIILNDVDFFVNTIPECEDINDVFESISAFISSPTNHVHTAFSLNPGYDKFDVAEKTAVALENKSLAVKRLYLTQQQLGKKHPVFSLLLSEEPNLLSPKGLSTLLADCRNRSLNPDKVKNKLILNNAVYASLSSIFDRVPDREIMRRIMADPKGWTLNASEDVKKGAEYYDRLGQLFGTQDLTDLFTYHVIRDNIQAIQKELSISGVIDHHVSIRDHLFSYKQEEGQLEILEFDHKILKMEVPKIVDFFLKILDIEPKYSLFRENNDENLISCDKSEIFELLDYSFKASIICESCEWEKCDDGWRGKFISKKDPDKIKLLLYPSNDDKGITCFVAVHPDL